MSPPAPSRATIRAAVSRIALYVAILLAPLVLAAVFRPRTDHGFVYELGKSFALLGFTVLAMQMVIAARFKWVERPFGLDMLFRFHKAMGILAAVLLLGHPLLCALGGKGWAFLIGADAPWYIWAGRVALALLLVHGFVSVFRLAIRLEYQTWRRIHDILAVAVVGLGFAHSWSAGGDLKLTALRVAWIGLLAAAGAAFTLHRLVRPWWERRHAWEVVAVRQETPRVWTLEFAPPPGETRYDYLPGQFHFITLVRADGLPVEEHHFTIASSPTESETIRSTIKQSGDFTATIGQTRPGDRAAIRGPYGRFSCALHPGESDLVFLAAGIGITPLMSMLRYLRDTGSDRNVVLLYGNRTEEEIVFRDELAQMEAGGHPQLKVVHVLSRPGGTWQGPTGRLDRKAIQDGCADLLDTAAFYLCGPPAMSDATAQTLRDLGVPEKRIHRERFSL